MLDPEPSLEARLARREAVDSPSRGRLVGAPQVMRSPAGYYIGQYCYEWEDPQWIPLPYSRLTSYYGTEDEAYIELNMFLHELGEILTRVREMA